MFIEREDGKVTFITAVSQFELLLGAVSLLCVFA